MCSFRYTSSMQMQRQTRQRELILRTIAGAGAPLSVGEVLARAGVELPGLGRATVYRTLKLLLAQGGIVAVELPGEETRYEGAGKRHHHHFRCLDCDRWFEMDRCLVAQWDGATLPGGYLIEGHHLTLYGRCPACVD